MKELKCCACKGEWKVSKEKSKGVMHWTCPWCGQTLTVKKEAKK